MNRQTFLSPLVIGTLMCLPLIILQACSSTTDPQNWYEGNGPVIPHDNFPGNCSLCHEGNQWNLVKEDFEFDHLAETGVALEGAHEQAQCLRCHNDRGPVAAFSANGCAGCHEDVHLTQLGRNCESCHGQETWRPQGQIAKHSMTRFPLVGAHAAAACFRCHPGSEAGQFSPTDTACESCHSDLAANVTAPNHLAQGWLTDCQQCHMATSWRSVGGFGHDDWPLTGAHASADCLECHTSGQFEALPNNCYSCHDAEFVSTTDPDHVAFGFATTCQDCHSTNRWEGARFSHTGIINSCLTCHLEDYQDTNDPNHAALGYQTDCEDCHSTNTWSGANFAHVGIVDSCVTCHLEEYQITTNPDHVGNGYPTACQDCHGVITWSGAIFNHAGVTNSCVTCHLSDYQGTDDPNHSEMGLSTSCEDCHTTNQWDGATFDHNTTSNTCISCHLRDFQNTTDPDHPALGIPTSCQTCHGTNNWHNVSFDHGGVTDSCSRCHMAEYNNTTDPEHSLSGFPTSCEDCHGTNTWQGATFDHSFPLVEDHANRECVDCHTTNNAPAFECIDCHAHRLSEMLDEHDGVGGFVWASAACFSCHPDGTAPD